MESLVRRARMRLLRPDCAALSFEVASVRPASPSEARVFPSMRGGPDTSDAERIVFTNVTLLRVLERVYVVKAYHVKGPASFLHRDTTSLPKCPRAQRRNNAI